MIVTLKDITTKITKGTTPTSIGCKFEKSGINFIKSESLVDGKTIDKSKFAFISERTHERLKRSQIEENDILFSMAGMFLGKTGIATAEVVPANTNQAVAIIRVDDTKANYEYVYYYLNQKSVIHTINTTSAQSAQPNINLKQIATVYKGNIIKNLIMDCQSYTKYRPNETTGGIFVSWRRKEELPTGA